MAEPVTDASGVADLVGQVNEQAFLSAPDIKHQRSGWRGGWDDLPTEEITLSGSSFRCHSEERGLPEIEEWLIPGESSGKSPDVDWSIKLVHIHFRVTSGTWLRDICAEDFCKLARVIGLAEEIIPLDTLEVFGLRCVQKSPSAPLSFILKLGRVSFAMWTYDIAKKQTLGIVCFSHAFGRLDHYAQKSLQAATWSDTVSHPLGFLLDLKERVTRSMSDDLGRAVRSLSTTSTKVLLRMETNAADYNTLFEDLAQQVYKTLDCHMLRSFCSLKQAYKLKDAQAFMRGLEADQRQHFEQSKQAMLQYDSDLHASLDSRHLELQLLKERMAVMQRLLLNRATRMDTETKLAISREQMLIARATMRDVSSMNIMTTMTTIFLPATFFSTLFAMSGLKWEFQFYASPPFWIYLLCSVLSTTLISIVWYRAVEDTEARALAEIDRVREAKLR